MIPTSASGAARADRLAPPSRARAAGDAPPRPRRPRSSGRARARPTRARSRRTTHGSLCVIQWRTRSPSRADDGLGVLDERLGGRARRPAARVLERLRRVPVEERRERLDPVREQLVDEPVVEVEARLVHPAAPLGKHARPRDREAERVEPELAHQRDVLAVAVVEVARDLAGVAVPHLAGRRAEAVPDALAAAVLVGRALDLVRGRGGAPDEVVGKMSSVGGHGLSSRSGG